MIIPPRYPHDHQGDLDVVSAIPAVETILNLVCDVTGMGFAAVARVTEDRWICCAVRDDIRFGLVPGGELKVETTICNEIRASRQGVSIDHVAQHPAFRDHHTPAMYGFASYISLPILLADGSMFGTLCAIDPRPAKVDTPKVFGMFKMFADLIAFNVDNHRLLAASEADLSSERDIAAFREQFIAILGHDLKNPLAAMLGGTKMLQRTGLDARSAEVVRQMQATALRMADLVTNVLDFARGRMGGGLPLVWQRADLAPVLHNLANEVPLSHPGREVVVEIADIGSVPCDPKRLEQLFSNLIGNALTHGRPDAPVRVHARTEDGEFVLSVANDGDPIPDHVANRMFKPFVRATTENAPQGLGLGLYIASEIAKAHGGSLSYRAADGRTIFTFRMPMRAQA